MPVLANIYVVQDLQGNLIMATDTESQINKYKTSDYQITILNKSSKSTPSTSQSQSNSDIKIVDWTNYVSDTGNYYYVEGILQNIGNSDVKSVRIKVQAFDKNKNLVSITDGYADPSIITPNQKATFSVMVSFKPEIYNFVLSVLWN
jgi:hypothetical protein